MASAKNAVVAGDYAGCYIGCSDNEVYIKSPECRIIISREYISSYRLITNEKGKSLSSAVVRGAVGGILFNVVGLVGGVLLAKDDHIYTVSLDFNDGKRSLIEVDDRRYKTLLESCF